MFAIFMCCEDRPYLRFIFEASVELLSEVNLVLVQNSDTTESCSVYRRLVTRFTAILNKRVVRSTRFRLIAKTIAP